MLGSWSFTGCGCNSSCLGGGACPPPPAMCTFFWTQRRNDKRLESRQSCPTSSKRITSNNLVCSRSGKKLKHVGNVRVEYVRMSKNPDEMAQWSASALKQQCSERWDPSIKEVSQLVYVKEVYQLQFRNEKGRACSTRRRRRRKKQFWKRVNWWPRKQKQRETRSVVLKEGREYL